MRLASLYHLAQKISAPRLRLLETIGNLQVYEVEGNLIRSRLDPNFTNFGQHFRFPQLIPLWELWIDQEATPGELSFFLTNLLVQYRLMEEGASYEEAQRYGSQAESAERRRQVQDPPFAGNRDEIRTVELRVLKSLKGIRIVLVDGERVRTHFFVDFTEGGHDLVYNFVPQRTIWVDNDLYPSEWPFVILHEFVERQRMQQGASYAVAHAAALRHEWDRRHSLLMGAPHENK
jgi:hypothetical protein